MRTRNAFVALALVVSAPTLLRAGEARLVKDISPGSNGVRPYSSSPSGLCAFGDLLFFSASDGEGPHQLWLSDGTLEGTKPFLKDALPVAEFTDPIDLTVMDDRLFFGAYGLNSEPVLWISDGTPETTVLLKRFGMNPGSPPQRLKVVGHRLFFVMPSLQDSLWVSDGTETGTQQWSEALGFRGHWKFDLEPPVALGNQLFFVADDGVHGAEIWVSDGTHDGTRLFVDLVPGAKGSYPSSMLAAAGDRLFFLANTDLEHLELGIMELWASDGTPEGTLVISKVVPGWPAALGDRLFFNGSDPQHESELWVSDGTPNGTVLLKDISAPLGLFGSYGSVPKWLTAVGDRLFFAAYDPEHGGVVDNPCDSLPGELWVSDGTAEGTVLFKDIIPGPVGSGPEWITVVGDRLFFSARDLDHGRELWVLPLDDVSPRFHRGDPNSSGATDISDGIAIVGFLFLGDPPALLCNESADVNNDGTIDISDGISILNWLFIGGPKPVAPGPTGMPCGFDPDPAGSPGDLGCASYDHCN